jgi:hypothetical protein
LVQGRLDLAEGLVWIASSAFSPLFIRLSVPLLTLSWLSHLVASGFGRYSLILSVKRVAGLSITGVVAEWIAKIIVVAFVNFGVFEDF